MNGTREKELVFTIGHSNHRIERFLDLLEMHGIKAVADVRSSPYSRFNPHFNRESLKSVLKARGIAYVFLGRELGARSEDSSCYEGGQVRYQRLACTQLFRSGIDRILDGSHRMRIALMCAEKEPLDCHRTILVARKLVAQGAEVVHILADGNTEHHEESLQRLFDLERISKQDLFSSGEELRDRAYAARERRIAYSSSDRAKEPQEVGP